MSFPFPVIQLGDESRLAKFESCERLGEGKYADIFKGRRKSDGQLVAIKTIKIFDMPSGERNECINEAKLLSSVQQGNIIACHDAFIENNELIMILELTDGGNLAQLITNRKAHNTRFSEQDLWAFIYFISLGLAHMHSKRIMHRDIKPANVYITTKGDIKLGDLGLGRIFSSVTDYAASQVGTPYYMSPELIQGEKYDYKSDVWSLGCLLYELSMLQLPFSDDSGSFYHLGKKIIDCDFPAVQGGYSDKFRTLIHSMIQKDSTARPTAEEVVAAAATHVSSYLKETTQDSKVDGSSSSSSSSSGGSEEEEGGGGAGSAAVRTAQLRFQDPEEEERYGQKLQEFAKSTDKAVLLRLLQTKTDQYTDLQISLQKQKETLLMVESALDEANKKIQILQSQPHRRIQALQHKLTAAETLCKKLLESGLYWRQQRQKRRAAANIIVPIQGGRKRTGAAAAESSSSSSSSSSSTADRNSLVGGKKSGGARDSMDRFF